MEIRDLEKRLAQLKREVQTRGLECHPLIVKAVTDLPPKLQSPDVMALAAQETPQTIIALAGVLGNPGFWSGAQLYVGRTLQFFIFCNQDQIIFPCCCRDEAVGRILMRKLDSPAFQRDGVRQWRFLHWTALQRRNDPCVRRGQQFNSSLRRQD